MAARRGSRRGRSVATGPELSAPDESVRPANSGNIVRYRSQDGLSLAARVFTAAGSERLPVLCLPGLSRNSRDFIALGRYLSEHESEPRTVVALDYRGRGLSDSDRNWRNYKPIVEAQDTLAACVVLGIERAILLGTSRGGIIAMLIGALRPTLLAGAALNDIGPIVEGTGLARIKNYLTARRLARSWDEAIAMLRHVNEGQFPGLAPEDWRYLAEAYFAETPGGLAPQFDPNLVRAIEEADFSERIPPLWPQFHALRRVPVLAIRGEFSDILSPRTLALMADSHPQFEQLTVRGQSHAPLLRDEATLGRLSAFARRCDGE